MRQIDAHASRAASRKPRQVNPRTAADVQNPPPAPTVEVDETREMMKFLEVIFVQV